MLDSPHPPILIHPVGLAIAYFILMCQLDNMSCIKEMRSLSSMASSATFTHQSRSSWRAALGCVRTTGNDVVCTYTKRRRER